MSVFVALTVGCSDDESSNGGKTGGAGTAGNGGSAGSAGGAGEANDDGGSGGSAPSAGGNGGSAGSAGSAGNGGLGGQAGEPGAAGAGEGGGSGDGIPAGCTEIQLQGLQYDSNASQEDLSSIFRATLATTLGGSAVDGMTLNVVSADLEELNATGAFELGEGVEANYSTCVHCIVVVQDAGEANTKRFFPVAGTMNVSASTPAGYADVDGFEGSLVGVQLVEVTIGGSPNFTSTPVAGGDCLYISQYDFDAP